jgi:hypothetical protein
VIRSPGKVDERCEVTFNVTQSYEVMPSQSESRERKKEQAGHVPGRVYIPSWKGVSVTF